MTKMECGCESWDCKCPINDRRERIGLRPLLMHGDGIDGKLTMAEYVAQCAFWSASHIVINGKWRLFVNRPGPRNRLTDMLLSIWSRRDTIKRMSMLMVMAIALVACKRVPVNAYVAECNKRGEWQAIGSKAEHYNGCAGDGFTVVQTETIADCNKVAGDWFNARMTITNHCEQSMIAIREWEVKHD